MRSFVAPWLVLTVVIALLLVVASPHRPTAIAPEPEIDQPIDYGNGVYQFPTVTGIGMEERYGKGLSVFLGAHPELVCVSGGSVANGYVLTQFLICRQTGTVISAQEETVP